MSWIERSEMYSRTSSRASSVSNDNSPPESNELNLTLYGASVPLRRTRTIIHRAKGRTLRTLSLAPGVGSGGNVAKLFAENTTLDLGFNLPNDEIDNCTNPYHPIGESSSNRTSLCLSGGRRESDSSDVAESEHSDGCVSKSIGDSSVESSPGITPVDNITKNIGNISRSSTCASWTTDEYSIRSEHGSESKNMDDCDVSNGEWSNFWKKYNHGQNTRGLDIIPVLPSEEIRSDSSLSSVFEHTKRKVPEKRSPQIQKVIMSTADAIEAASCARRLSEILSSAIRRSSLPCTSKDVNDRNLFQLTTNENSNETIPEPPPLPANETIFRSKSESEIINITSTELQNKKLSLKPLAEDRVEIEIQSTDPLNIAAILQKVLNQRRDLIMPAEESASGCQSHRSDWSSFD